MVPAMLHLPSFLLSTQVCHSNRDKERFQCCDGLSLRCVSVYSYPSRQAGVGVLSLPWMMECLLLLYLHFIQESAVNV